MVYASVFGGVSLLLQFVSVDIGLAYEYDVMGMLRGIRIPVDHSLVCLLQFMF